MSSEVVRKGILELIQEFENSNTTMSEEFFRLETKLEYYEKKYGNIPVSNTTSWSDWALNNAIPMTISISFGMLGGFYTAKMFQSAIVNEAVTKALEQAAVDNQEVTTLAVTKALEQAAVENKAATTLALEQSSLDGDYGHGIDIRHVDSDVDSDVNSDVDGNVDSINGINRLFANVANVANSPVIDTVPNNGAVMTKAVSFDPQSCLSPMARVHKKVVATPGSALKAQKIAEEIKSGAESVVSIETMLSGVDNFVELKFIKKGYNVQAAENLKLKLNIMLTEEWPNGATTAETFSALSYIYSDDSTLSSHQTDEENIQFKEIFDNFKKIEQPSEKNYIDFANDLGISEASINAAKEIAGYDIDMHESAYLSYLVTVVTISLVIAPANAMPVNETRADDFDYDDLDRFETEEDSTEMALVPSEPSFVDGLVSRAPAYGNIAAVSAINGAVSTGVSLVVPAPYSVVANIVSQKAVSNTWAGTLQESYNDFVNMDSYQALGLATSVVWSCVAANSLHNALPQTSSYPVAVVKSVAVGAVAKIAFEQGEKLLNGVEQVWDKAVEQAIYLEEVFVELYDHATCPVDC